MTSSHSMNGSQGSEGQQKCFVCSFFAFSKFWKFLCFSSWIVQVNNLEVFWGKIEGQLKTIHQCCKIGTGKRKKKSRRWKFYSNFSEGLWLWSDINYPPPPSSNPLPSHHCLGDRFLGRELCTYLGADYFLGAKTTSKISVASTPNFLKPFLAEHQLGNLGRCAPRGAVVSTARSVWAIKAN